MPGKNLRDLGGKPLLAWSVAAAKASRYLDRTILSTDDEAIMAAGRAAGCEVPFRRPAALATDEAGSIEVVIHALDAVGQGYDIVVLLQPTSPLRAAADIDSCLDRMIAAGAPCSVSVSPAAHPPYWFFRLDGSGRLIRLIESPAGAKRRQDLPETVMVNGAVYAADIAWLRRVRDFVTPETVAYVMPAERSVDIDTPLDLALARAILAGQAALN
jgi:N-acylneuraminate cytidylyltransferase